MNRTSVFLAVSVFAVVAANAATTNTTINLAILTGPINLNATTITLAGSAQFSPGIPDTTGAFNSAVSLANVSGSNATAPFTIVMSGGTLTGTITLPLTLVLGTTTSGTASASITGGTNTYAGATGFFPSMPATATGSASSGLAYSISGAGSVSVGQNLVVSSTAMTFNATAGGAAPSPQTLNITSTAGALSFTATAISTGPVNWLMISSTSGTAPASISVSVNPTGLTPGTYDGFINLVGTFSTGVVSQPITVILNVSPTPTLIGIFRPATPVGAALGSFTLDSNGNYAYDATDKTRQFGLAGDYPVAGDWDGTGVIRIGVFRCPAAGGGICIWYLDQNNNGEWDGTSGGDVAFQFGLPGDIPVVGDWSGTGSSKVGVMRCPAVGQPGVCTWYLDIQNLRSPNGSFLVGFYGIAGDLPAVGHWSGLVGSKPVDNIGVFRSGQWILNSSSSGFWTASDTQYAYGLPGDVPVVGNWQGASVSRIGVFRCPAVGQPGTCTWILNTTGSGQFSGLDLITPYGLPGDRPVVGFWTVQ